MLDDKTPAHPGDRDLRLDFLRGVTLLVVLIDHIEAQTSTSLIRSWTPRTICLFDGADAFLFLSGFVFGRVFQRRLTDRGYVACQQRSIERALRIYLTYLATVSILVGIGLCLQDYSPILANRLNLSEGAGRCMSWSVLMCYQPFGTSILPMYALILPFAPPLLFWQLRSRITAWILPFSLYIAAQVNPGLQLPRFPFGQWHFNPFAWQFLFFFGLSAGTGGWGQLFQSRIRSILLFGSLVTLVIGVLIQKECLAAITGFDGIGQTMKAYATEWSNKTRYGPLRLIHFAAFVLILSTILPGAQANIWQKPVFAPIIKCGQTSLIVYSAGVILTFLSIPVFQILGESPGVVLMVEFDCCVLSVVFAFLASSQRLRKPTPRI
ncbi:MAG: OpgC domain-containing protein [Planctomycetota bacterium]